MFIFIVIFLVLIYYIMNEKSNIKLSESDKSLERLKERYISGEIDEETYLRMKKVLER